MSDYGKRIVLDRKLDAAIEILNVAIHAEGLTPLAEIDVRERFGRELSHDFRRYVLVHAWSPQFAMEALRHNLDTGTVLPAAIAVYELGDGETVVVTNPPFAAVADDYQWRREFPVLASLADREVERLARVIDRVAHASGGQTRAA